MVFSGADGSGKTTVARLLYTYLSLRGYDVCLYWFRGSHLLASILLRLLSRSSLFRGLCNPYYRVCIPTKLRMLWAFIEFTNLLPYLLLRSMIQHICFVICDRGVLDSIIWIGVTLNWPGFLRTLLGRFLLILASKEDIVYLYADTSILLLRGDVPREFLVKELALYSVLAKYLAKLSIDTGRYRPSQVATKIIKYLDIV